MVTERSLQKGNWGENLYWRDLQNSFTSLRPLDVFELKIVLDKSQRELPVKGQNAILISN